MRVVIDGGGNEWLKYANTHFKNLPVKKPDFLTGDMDSITKSSMKELEALGVKVVPTPDQDETDFTKSLMSMYGELQAKQVSCWRTESLIFIANRCFSCFISS